MIGIMGLRSRRCGGEGSRTWVAARGIFAIRGAVCRGKSNVWGDLRENRVIFFDWLHIGSVLGLE
jgi:hypothetical protein